MNQPENRWLEWQRDHAAALAALQDAQRAYHRTVVARAFPGDSPQSVVNVPQAALDVVDAARVRLDAVRARMPE